MTDREIALEPRGVEDARLLSPSAARNRDAIRDAFLDLMPRTGRIVEIASGTGEHAVHIAAALPGIRWCPGDPDAASCASVAAWTAHLGLPNIAAPHAIDVCEATWRTGAPLEGPESDGPLDGVVCINMLHIAPIAATEGLIAGAGRRLRSGGRLFLYGPFSRNGAHIAASNAQFDASLKSRNAGWGVRDLERDVVPNANAAGLALVEARAMPANNFSVVFERH